MSRVVTASSQAPAARLATSPFREDGTFRLEPSLSPGRHRPRDQYRPPTVRESPVAALRPRVRFDAAAWDRGRQLAIMGDPLADDFVALYPSLGYTKARAMLDTALDRGIEHVENAPEALKALFAELDNPPSWVDWQRIERGAAALRRSAPLTWLFARLAFAQTYVNANAGMPLYMTGSLGEKTVAKRLRETDRWRLGILAPGALERFGDGFKTVVRVRVLHAMIRFHLLKSGEWDSEKLGMPIPQLDMAGANIGMFMTHTQLPQALGAVMTPSEYRDAMHLWRYHGRIIGVLDELNPTSERDLNRIGALITVTTRRGFDERGGELTRATLNTPLRPEGGWLGKVLDFVDVRVSHGLYQLTNGNRTYKEMGLTEDPKWLWFLPAMFPIGLGVNAALRLTPGGIAFAERVGERYIQKVMQDDDVKNAPFRPYHMGAS